MKIAVMPMEKPESPLFTMSCYSDHVILVPPDKNLLLHVDSDGFHEWDQSIGNGKPVNLPFWEANRSECTARTIELSFDPRLFGVKSPLHSKSLGRGCRVNSSDNSNPLKRRSLEHANRNRHYQRAY